MSRSLIHRIGLRGRTAVLVTACALVTAGAMAMIGSATSSAAPSGLTHSCSTATLNGKYSEAAIGWNQDPTNHVWAPVSTASFSTFNGAGGGTGTATAVQDGVPAPDPTTFTFSYTVKSNCTGTLTVDFGSSTTVHYDLYVNPSGDSFRQVENDPNTANADTQTRVG